MYMVPRKSSCLVTAPCAKFAIARGGWRVDDGQAGSYVEGQTTEIDLGSRRCIHFVPVRARLEVVPRHKRGKSPHREARPNQASAASLSCISRMTIIKTSASYFACASPATTAASLSSI
jgi:hypothetical protein